MEHIDTLRRSRQYVLSICFIVMAVVAGLWMGEHPRGLLRVRDIAVGLGVVLSAALAVRREGRVTFAAAAIGAVLVFGFAWFAGAREATYAFNDCVQNGQQVRAALSTYRLVHGRFPQTLAELGMHLPGELLLPPHKLVYGGDSAAYVLSFSDALVTHSATESEEFLARK